MKVAEGPMGAPALDLFSRVFGAERAFRDEYPLLFEEDGPDSLVWAEEEGVTLSACGIQARDLVLPDEVVRVGLIGSVATDPASRGQGLAHHVLSKAEAVLAARGSMISLLWADDPSFYEHRGYREIGRETDFVLDPNRRALLPLANGVRIATAEDGAEIHDLYLGHAARVDRSPRETRALLASPGMVVLVRGVPGSVTGYLCLGRGEDLRSVIHEWGGATGNVLALVGACLSDHMQGAEQLYLMAAPGDRNLMNTLDELGFPSAEGCLGLARLLDADAATRLAMRRVGPEMTAGVHPNGEIRLTGPRAAVDLTPENFLVLLFPARGERGSHRVLGQEIGVDMSPLALEPFLWGLDSI